MKMLKRDENIRIGQELYSFLNWLYNRKGVNDMDDTGIADPFNIPDEDWNKWLQEFRKTTNE